MNKKNSEYEKFDATMRQLMKVSHADLKAALDAERARKADKPRRRRKAAKPSE